MVKRTVSMILCAILLASAVGAQADDESLRRATEELLAAMKVHVTLLKSLEKQAAAGGGSPEMLEATRKFYATYLDWESLRPEMVAIYMAKFSEDELKELTAFYRTPAGRKLRETQPELSAAVLKIVRARTIEHMAEYRRMMAEAMGKKPQPTPQPTAEAEVQIEADESELNALFIVSFRETELPAGTRAGDIKAGVLGTVLRRLQALGIEGIDIESVSGNTIALRISAMSVFGRDDIAQLLGRSGDLSFRLVSADNKQLVTDLQRDPDGFRAPDGYEKCEIQVKRGEQLDAEVLFVQSRPEGLSSEDVAQAIAASSKFGHWPISLTFTPRGAHAFRKITAENVGRRLAIVIDGEICSAPVIRQAIRARKAQILGDLTAKEAKLLAAAIDSGRYPVPVQVDVRE